MSYRKIVNMTIDGKEYIFQMEGIDWLEYSYKEIEDFIKISSILDLKDFIRNKLLENRCGDGVLEALKEKGELENQIQEEIDNYLQLV